MRVSVRTLAAVVLRAIYEQWWDDNVSQGSLGPPGLASSSEEDESESHGDEVRDEEVRGEGEGGQGTTSPRGEGERGRKR